MYNNGYDRHPLAIQRAREKQKRDRERATRTDSPCVWTPFPMWLRYARGVTDWRKLKRYDLWNYYLDYRVECVENGMLYELGSVYGLTNV